MCFGKFYSVKNDSVETGTKQIIGLGDFADATYVICLWKSFVRGTCHQFLVSQFIQLNHFIERDTLILTNNLKKTHIREI